MTKTIWWCSSRVRINARGYRTRGIFGEASFSSAPIQLPCQEVELETFVLSYGRGNEGQLSIQQTKQKTQKRTQMAFSWEFKSIKTPAPKLFDLFLSIDERDDTTWYGSISKSMEKEPFSSFLNLDHVDIYPHDPSTFKTQN